MVDNYSGARLRSAWERRKLGFVHHAPVACDDKFAALSHLRPALAPTGMDLWARSTETFKSATKN